MRIDILTLFPEMFPGYLGASILQRAQDMGLLEVEVHDIRLYAAGKHRITDEPPYGGGGGMVLKPEPIFAAVEAVLSKGMGSLWQEVSQSRQEADGLAELGDDLGQPEPSEVIEAGHSSETPHIDVNSCPVILLTPQGRLFTQAIARKLAIHERLLLLCGRYEGVDERVRKHLATDEISIGDYVLTGGELAAMVVVDALTRLIPGVLGAAGAAETDSHAAGLLEGPHYTRPENFRGWSVPELLRSGHAANIYRWRRQQALRRTWIRRPELLLEADLDEADKLFLADLAEEVSRRQP